MTAHKSKGDRGEVEFTRAAYDTLEDYQESYGVATRHSVWLTEQRGVLAFVASVRKKGHPSTERPIIVHTDYWPSATDLSWAAFWFQHCFKTARMVEAWALEEKKNRAEQKAIRTEATQ